MSAISAPELSIKQTSGKLTLRGSVSEMIRKKNMQELPVTVSMERQFETFRCTTAIISSAFLSLKQKSKDLSW